MKTIKLTHKQAMRVVECLDTLYAMDGSVDDDFNRDCEDAGKLSEVITKQLTKLGYCKLDYETLVDVDSVTTTTRHNTE